MKVTMNNQKAFTLTELLIVIALMAVMMSIAIPNYKQLVYSNRLTTYANDFIAATTIARSEAVKRGNNVTLSAVGGNWAGGWNISDSGGNTIRVFPALEGTVTFIETGSATSITFNNMGGASATATLQMCDGRTGETGREIQINLGGRPSVSDYSCS